MRTDSTIQVRVGSQMKKRADKTLKDMGLDLSSGIKLFLHQVVRSRSIPFSIRTGNGFTPAQEKRMIKETKAALRHRRSYKTAQELFDSVLK